MCFAFPTALTAVSDWPTTMYPNGIGSRLNRLTTEAPIIWDSIRYLVLDEFSRDMKNIAWANLLIPTGPLGNSIVGREHDSRIVLTVLSSRVDDFRVDPPIIIAVVPWSSRSVTIWGRLFENFSGSMSARCMQPLSLIPSTNAASTGPGMSELA